MIWQIFCVKTQKSWGTPCSLCHTSGNSQAHVWAQDELHAVLNKRVKKGQKYSLSCPGSDVWFLLLSTMDLDPQPNASEKEWIKSGTRHVVTHWGSAMTSEQEPENLSYNEGLWLVSCQQMGAERCFVIRYSNSWRWAPLQLKCWRFPSPDHTVYLAKSSSSSGVCLWHRFLGPDRAPALLGWPTGDKFQFSF